MWALVQNIFTSTTGSRWFTMVHDPIQDVNFNQSHNYLHVVSDMFTF